MPAIFDKAEEDIVEGVEATKDQPGPSPDGTANDPKGALELIRFLIGSVSGARIGYYVLEAFATRFQLQDIHPWMFRVFLCVSIGIDFTLSLIAIVLVVYLLISVTYAIVRGLGDVVQTDHIVSVAIHWVENL